MNDNVNVPSKYQDSLPVLSDTLMGKLGSWEIVYIPFDQVPLRTVADSKKVQGQVLSSEEDGSHIKISICAITKSATYSWLRIKTGR
jgi:Ala-tRNA(Pro) deacylase